MKNGPDTPFLGQEDPKVKREAADYMLVEAGEDGRMSNSIQPKLPKRPPRNRLTLQVLALYVAFIGEGLCFTTEGPALPELTYILGTTTTGLSLGLTLCSVGYLIGTAVCGWSFEKLQHESQLATVSVTVAAMTAIEPFSGSLPVFIVILLLKGLASGYFNTGVQYYVMYILHGHRLQGSGVQGLYSFVCVGGIISPLVMQAFLSPRGGNITTQQNTSLLESSQISNFPLSNLSFPKYLSINDSVWSYEAVTSNETTDIHGNSQVGIGFAIIAGVTFILSIPMWILSCTQKKFCSHPPKKTLGTESKKGQRNVSPKKIQKYAVLFLLFLWRVCFLGIEIVLTAFLTTWAVEILSWTNRQGALLMMAYWISYLLFRTLGIPVAVCFSPRQMTICGMCITLLSCGVWTLFYRFHAMVVWTCVVGAGMGVAWPYGSLLTETPSFLPMTGPVSAILQLGNGVGRIITPITTGYLIDRYSADSMLYVLCSMSVMIGLIYAVLQFIIRLKSQPNNQDFIHDLPRENDEDRARLSL